MATKQWLTAYQVKHLQLEGKLPKEDYPRAIETYQKKIDFLDECLKEASPFDYQTLFEDKERFMLLQSMLQTSVNNNEISFTEYLKKLQFNIDFIRTSS